MEMSSTRFHVTPVEFARTLKNGRSVLQYADCPNESPLHGLNRDARRWSYPQQDRDGGTVGVFDEDGIMSTDVGGEAFLFGENTSGACSSSTA